MKQNLPKTEALDPDISAVKAEYLLTFCEVADAGSLSDAAHALGVTQPAVSRQLSQLQKAVGYALYTRTAYGVTLTAAGRDLLPYARAVAHTLNRVRHYLRGDLGERSLSLRIGLSHHLITRYTGPILKAVKTYQERVGALQVHLIEGYSRPLIQQVSNQQLDAALVLGELQTIPDTLASSRLSEDDICLLVLPDDKVAVETYTPLSVLQGETLILSSSDSQVFEKVQDTLAKYQVKPGRILEVSGPAAVRSAVVAGEGIGVTLRSYVAPETTAGWLRCVGLENKGFTIGVNSVTPDPATLNPETRHALSAILSLA